MTRVLDHGYIFLTITFTVYSQLVIRWQVSSAGPLPTEMTAKILYVLTLLMTPWVMSGIVATFFSGIFWMLAMTKFEISYAYPFVSLNFILVLIAGILVFQESVSITKIIGSGLVIIGIIVIAKG